MIKAKSNTNVDLSLPSKRYRAIYISVGVMIALFLIVLLINLYFSVKSKDDGLELNLAGRQRMLSQRITKLVNRISDVTNKDKSGSTSSEINELKIASELFNKTHNGFIRGGDTIGGDNKTTVRLARNDEPAKVAALNQVDSLWISLYPKLSLVTSSGNVNREMLASLVEEIQVTNLEILKHTNKFTELVEAGINRKNQLLRNLQLVGLVTLVLILAWFVFFIIKRFKLNDAIIQANADSLVERGNELAAQNQSLAAASLELESTYTSLVKQSNELVRLEQEADSIFKTVQIGLCLITSDGRIGSRVSDTMFEIFETQSLAGRNFEDLMKNIITEQDQKTLSRYMQMLFEGKTKEKQLEKYSPLTQLEVNLKQPSGGFSTKILNFSFKRIVQNNQVTAVLCTVRDMTAQISLENTLKRNEENKQRQMEMLLQMVQSNPRQLKSFFNRSKDALESINEFLKRSSVSCENRSQALDNHRSMVEFIGGKIHEIKGSASMLKLGNIVEASHNIEDSLRKIKNQNSVTGDQFISSLIGMINLKRDLAEMEDLLSNLSDHQFVRAPAPSEKVNSIDDDSQLNLITFANEVAARNNKRVNVDLRGFYLGALEPDMRPHINDVLVQLVRNSIAHGIEIPTDRVAVGKAENGMLMAFTRFIPAENSVSIDQIELVFRDDGRGLNIDEISQKAIKAGIITDIQALKMNSDEIVPLLFKSGFSTVTSASEDAGHGLGMNIVKEKIMSVLKGSLQVRYETGRFFELTARFPSNSHSA